MREVLPELMTWWRGGPDSDWIGRRLIVRPEGDGIPLEGNLGSGRAQAAIADDARGLLASGRTELLTYGPDGQRRGEGLGPVAFIVGYLLGRRSRR